MKQAWPRTVYWPIWCQEKWDLQRDIARSCGGWDSVARIAARKTPGLSDFGSSAVIMDAIRDSFHVRALPWLFNKDGDNVI